MTGLDLAIVEGETTVITGTVVDAQGTTQIGIGFGGQGPGCRSGRSQVGADWTFTVEGLAGTCVVRVWGGGHWLLKSIVHEGRDLHERPMTFERVSIFAACRSS
jgi:hypothetical protein